MSETYDFLRDFFGCRPAAPDKSSGWDVVEVVAVEGTVCGVVENCGGKLSLVVKRSDEPWPHGVRPIKASVNMIGSRCSRYVVRAKKK